MDLTKSFFSLLALINPIGAIPFFISLTESQTCLLYTSDAADEHRDV